MSKANVLIVDDEKNILSSVQRALDLEGYTATVAGSAELALDRLADSPIDLILLDVKLPAMDGIALLEKLSKERPGLPVVMMSAHGSIQVAVEATKLGARDFIEKPLSYQKLFITIDNILRIDALERENTALKREVEKKYELIGESEPMKKLRERIEVTAPTNGRVLITGEHGTGKELVARAMHNLSKRERAPFIKVNCAAIPKELIESELFGHERGAFTGATATRRGKFEMASGGTLFLDEIGDMKVDVQAKLLRVLQENEIERVGSSETIQIDVRLLAATNKDLPQEIAQDHFREDLYYRLNVVPFVVPPLRDRRDDIPILAKYFAELACIDNDRRMKTITPSALELLASLKWPGNVRELKNIVERLVILVPSDTIDTDDILEVLPAAVTSEAASTISASGSNTLRDRLSGAERSFILEALTSNKWQIAKTARYLGLERSHLYKKMKLHNINRDDQQ